jgi:nucleolar complex protein 3
MLGVTGNVNCHLALGVGHEDLPTILKTLELAVLQRHKKLSQQRMLAFTKRLATLAMQLLHNGSISCLAVIRTIMQVCI